jgi:hypothetical protein
MSIDDMKRALVYESFNLKYAVRLQLLNALRRSIGGERKLGPHYTPAFNPPDVWHIIYDQLSAEIGLPMGSRRDAEELVERFVIEHDDAHQVLTAMQIAVSFVCENQRRLKSYDNYFPPQYDCDQLVAKVNSVLSKERVEYQLLNGTFVQTGSDYLYTEVVEPALQLLTDSRFDVANVEFRAAWERNRESPSDKTALSLANGALESTMKHILKARGVHYREGVDTSSALISAIMKTGILKPWQDGHLDELTKLLTSGAPRVRNREGSHGPEPDSIPPAPHLIKYGVDLAAATIVMLVEAHNATPNPSQSM